jgi:hypothetical protein
LAASTNCRNCDSPLLERQRFCGECGQRVGRGRLAMRDIAHDFLHALFHVDHSIVALLRALLTRPGLVALEYVQGRRKKYFGPFAFLMITVAVASFIVALSGVSWITTDVSNGLVEFLQRHVNLLALFQMPLLAALCAFLFWSDRLNYAEHLVLAAYTTGFKVLVLSLVAVPIVYFAGVESVERWSRPTYLVVWLGYFSLAAAQFYRGRKLSVIVRAIVAALLTQALTLGIVILLVTGFARARGR